MGYTDYSQLPLVISVDELAKVLGVGRNTAYDLIRSERIYSVKCGHQIRIPKEALKTYLSECQG